MPPMSLATAKLAGHEHAQACARCRKATGAEGLCATGRGLRREIARAEVSGRSYEQWAAAGRPGLATESRIARPFVVRDLDDGTSRKTTARALERANREDPDVLAFVRRARVGDKEQFGGGGAPWIELERVG